MSEPTSPDTPNEPEDLDVTTPDVDESCADAGDSAAPLPPTADLTGDGIDDYDASDDSILDSLMNIYLSQPSLREAWHVEQKHLRAIIPAIRTSTAAHYRLGRALGVGGAGIVL